MSEPTIFVTNFNPAYNYDELKKLGKIVYMTRGHPDLSEAQQLYRIFLGFFEESEESDILCLSGPSALAAIAVSAWHNFHPSVNLCFMDQRREGSEVKFGYQLLHLEGSE